MVPSILVEYMNLHMDKEKNFENKQDNKAYCFTIVGTNCIKCKNSDNGNYNKIYCSEPNSQYQIIGAAIGGEVSKN